MRIVVDTDACQGHGQCYVRAPSLVSSDDAGFAVGTRAQVGPEERAEADAAVNACPERAVSLVGDAVV